ncbi:MAG: trigger factor [bacterium]|nr:trigger factor [bacterium]
MKILKSKRKANTYSLEIEESHDVMNDAVMEAFKKLSKSAKIPGFRKGKVTLKIFESHYGKDILIQEALMDIVNNAYIEAIKELDIPVIDQPKNFDLKEYKEDSPICFSCEVDVKPEVKLGKYKGIKADRPSDVINDTKVENAVNQVLEQRSSYELIDRECQKDDIARCSIEAKIDDTVYEQWTGNNIGLKIGANSFGDEVDIQITGMKKDEIKSFSIKYPADFHNKEVADKEVNFKVTVEELREKKLPELTDELVASLSKFKTIDEFKADIRTNLETEATKQSDEQMKSSILEKISANASVDIQQVLIDREIDFNIRQLENSLTQSNFTLDKYLEIIKKDKNQLRDEYTEPAVKRLKIDLILEAVSKKENLQVTDDQIDEEIKKLDLPDINTDEQIASYKQSSDLENLRFSLTQQKTLNFLVENSKINQIK